MGQRLVVAMHGTTPSAALLARVRSGQVGGVILFGANVRSTAQVRALTRSLRTAAQAGGRPALLIAVDQEGGSIRRFASAPPSRSAAQLGQLTPTRVRAEGRATAAALRAVGVNVDLAPVADIPSVSRSFIAAQARAFSTDPRRVAEYATAFAAGLADGGVAATAKHFPGLGRATVSTDVAAVTLRDTPAQLDTDALPYRSLIGAGVPLVMVSNAAYSALDGKPAAWSPAVQALLRRRLGFTGVTITTRSTPPGRPAIARSRPQPSWQRRPETTSCSLPEVRRRATPCTGGCSPPPRRESFPSRASSEATRGSSRSSEPSSAQA